jgi:hypothetical protein
MSDELLLYLMMAGRGKRPKWSESVGSLFLLLWPISRVWMLLWGHLVLLYIGQRTSHIYRACRPLIASAAAAVYIFML